MSVPIRFVWDGSAMIPARGFAARAERQYVPFETYTLEAVADQRSLKEHNHYMASVAEAFDNLDEKLSTRFSRPAHLRKWALIETGWFDEAVTDCGSQEVALRMAAFTRTLEGNHPDDYVEIIVRGPALVVRSAKSQKMHGTDAMSKEDFRASSKDVLDLLADMVGVNRTLLERYGKQRQAR